MLPGTWFEVWEMGKLRPKELLGKTRTMTNITGNMVCGTGMGMRLVRSLIHGACEVSLVGTHFLAMIHFDLFIIGI